MPRAAVSNSFTAHTVFLVAEMEKNKGGSTEVGNWSSGGKEATGPERESNVA